MVLPALEHHRLPQTQTKGLSPVGVSRPLFRRAGNQQHVPQAGQAGNHEAVGHSSGWQSGVPLYGQAGPTVYTHERELRLAEVTEFREGVRPLLKMGRLGCLLMQFPWSFRFTPENRRYLIELRRAFGEFPLVAEMRHASWAREEAVGTFIDYKVGFCNIDQPVFEKAMPPTAFLTSSIGYIRLHGRSALPQGREYRDGNIARNDYLYPESELADWVDRAQRIGRYADAVYVITTNDAAGKAVVNALQVQSLLGVRETKYPADLVRRHWPKLARRESSSLQHSLFGEGMVVPERAVA